MPSSVVLPFIRGTASIVGNGQIHAESDIGAPAQGGTRHGRDLDDNVRYSKTTQDTSTIETAALGVSVEAALSLKFLPALFRSSFRSACTLP